MKKNKSEAEVFRCTHCQDGKFIRAYRDLLEGKEYLLIAYRLGQRPKEKAFNLIEKSKKILGI